jgi:hypothetical protein
MPTLEMRRQDSAEIETKRVREQKTTRQDATRWLICGSVGLRDWVGVGRGQRQWRFRRRPGGFGR